MGKYDYLKKILKPIINEILLESNSKGTQIKPLTGKALESYIVNIVNTILDSKKNINGWTTRLHPYSDELIWIKPKKYVISIEPYPNLKPKLSVELYNYERLKLTKLPDEYEDFSTIVRYKITGDLTTDVEKYFELATKIIKKYGNY